MYDPNGNRTLLRDWSGRYTYTYDVLNRVSTMVDPGIPLLGVPPMTLSYAYDRVGNRKRMSDPNGGIYTSLYDAARQVIRVINPLLEVTSFLYDAVGQNTSKALANGTTVHMTYDADGNQERVLNLDGSLATISDYTYGFDGVGNRTSEDQPGVQYSNWTYDGRQQLGRDLYFDTGAWGRLTLPQWTWFTEADWDALPVDVLGVYTFEYAYDPAGNRLTQTDPGTGDVITYTYDPANRLQTSESVSGVTTYTYDDNGNQLTTEEPTGDITTNTWDCENRIIQTDHPDFTTTYYTYNADGARMIEDDGAGDVRKIVRDGKDPLWEVNDTGALLRANTFTLKKDDPEYAETISQNDGTDSSFYHPNGKTDITKVTDLSGMVTDEYFTDACGVLVDTIGTTDNLQIYKGLFQVYHTAEGLVSMFYRDSNPATNRFLSEDPIEKDNNLYRICRNNPVTALGLGRLIS